MATLTEKVGYYTVGLVPTPLAAALSDWLTNAARMIVDLLPADKLKRISLIKTFTTSTSLAYIKPIMPPLIGGIPARQIELNQSGQAADALSIHAATASDTVYYIAGGTLYSLPTGKAGSLEYVQYPIVNSTDSTINNFPLECEQLVVMNTAVQVLLKAKIDLIATLAAVSLPTVPTSPTFSIPSWTFAGLVYPVPLDISSYITSVDTYLDPNGDIESANAKMNEAQVKIQEWNATTNAFVDEVKSNASLKLDADKSLALAILQKEVQEYQEKLSFVSASLSKAQTNIKQIDDESASIQGAIDNINAEYAKQLKLQLGV